MGRTERQALINDIETMRGSKVITYFTSSRPPLRIGIDVPDLREIYDHLLKIGNSEKIDLYIYSLGGAGNVPWPLSNMIREFTDNFNVLVPSLAFSAATAIALGANSIIMGKKGILGPIDPSVANAFNPVRRGQVCQISTEDIGGYISLLKEKANLTDERNFAAALSNLCTTVEPLALGNAYRHYIKSRDDARKLLELHLDPNEEATMIDGIVETLVEKLYYHGHHIPRQEAKDIGLNIQKAEDIKAGDKDLDQLMWKLFIEYEEELKMLSPYKDEASGDDDYRIVPGKFIESNGATSAFVFDQEFHKMKLPEGTFFTQISTQKGEILALAVPLQNGSFQLIPYIQKNGNPQLINDVIYKKKEITFWKKFNSDEELYRTREN
jgi:hypothetical protein